MFPGTIGQRKALSINTWKKLWPFSSSSEFRLSALLFPCFGALASTSFRSDPVLFFLLIDPNESNQSSFLAFDKRVVFLCSFHYRQLGVPLRWANHLDDWCFSFYTKLNFFSCLGEADPRQCSMLWINLTILSFRTSWMVMAKKKNGKNG